MNESRFRWIGRPSEEELLGLPTHTPRRVNGFTPVPPAPRIEGAAAVVAAPRARPRARTLVAVAVVGAAAGLAFGMGARERPSEPPGPVDATVAGRSVLRTVLLDAHVRPLPARPRASDSKGRQRPSAAAEGHETPPPPSGQGSGGSGGSGNSSGSSGSTGSDDPKPPPVETSEPPMLEANVPLAGTVVVEKPDLPDAGQVLSGTETLP